MKVLVMAPHPFYQERGTPIAVDLLLKALSERGDEVDLLTFHEGSDRSYPGLKIERVKPWFSIGAIKPGFSLKKLLCDLHMMARFTCFMLTRKYDVVHAVEESSFMALLLCPLRRVPFIVDIDSSMTTQLVDKFCWLRPVEKLLGFFESLPIRFAAVVVPVCDALANDVRKYRTKNMVVLKDISLVQPHNDAERTQSLREELGVDNDKIMLMYIGNLESYQGIDLLLKSFQLTLETAADCVLVIIGGSDADIAKYKGIVSVSGIGGNVLIIGRRPVKNIGQYMSQADILVSPRIHGVNTPMKIYSYLDSGTVVLATRLPTHTQVMSSETGMLSEPLEREFSNGMSSLISDAPLRVKLAENAKVFIEKEHSYSAFKSRVDEIYTLVEPRL